MDSQGGQLNSMSYRLGSVPGEDVKMFIFIRAPMAPALGKRRKYLLSHHPLPVLIQPFQDLFAFKLTADAEPQQVRQ